MIKAVLFSLLVASALSMTLKKRGEEEEETLTHDEFAEGIAAAKKEFMDLSKQLGELNDLAADANKAVEEDEDYSKWEAIEKKMEEDLESHKDTFIREEEKLLSFAGRLYSGNSDFRPSGTCDAVYEVAKPLKDNEHVDPQAALVALEDDLQCFSRLAGGARHIPVVPAAGAPGDYSDEHAFDLTVSILSEVFKVRHAGQRFEEGARALDVYFEGLKAAAGQDAMQDLQTKRLVSLLRRVLKSMRK